MLIVNDVSLLLYIKSMNIKQAGFLGDLARWLGLVGRLGSQISKRYEKNP